MTTLIAVYGSDGECLGRCDARCYDAQEPECTCVCGGKNHGAGRAKAIENVREYAEAMIREYATKVGADQYVGEVDVLVWQMSLFEEDES